MLLQHMMRLLLKYINKEANNSLEGGVSVLLPPGLLVEVLAIFGTVVATDVGSGIKGSDVCVQRDLVRVSKALTEGTVRPLTECGLRFHSRSRWFVRSRVSGESQVFPCLLVVAVESALVSTRVKCADRLSVDGTPAILQPEAQIGKKGNMRFSSVI